MLPKPYRLPLTTNFERIKKEGRMVNGPMFGLLIATRNNGLGTRFGFIISTKVSKKAVVRHRIKRLLSEAVRLSPDKIKPGYDFVFLAKKEIIGKGFKEVKKEVEDRLKRANLFV